MRVIVFFEESEAKVSNFEFYTDLLDKVLDSYLNHTPFPKMSVMFSIPGGPNEAQKEKACNKGVCKQRRNKAVKDVSKSS